MKFTKEQNDGINAVEGCHLVVAGAGSGKTSVYTNRIGKLITVENVMPNEILAITFTKKASEEMQKRLTKLVGKERASKVAMGTFHSLGYRLLKALDGNFNRYELAPDWWVLGKLGDMCKMRSDRNPHGLNIGLRVGELAQFITYQKLNMISTTDELLIDEQVSFVDTVSKEDLRRAYVLFERLKEESRMMTFDDLLYKFYLKLRDDVAFRSRIQAQYKYVMVDEFQDSSVIMVEIVRLINDRNVFVVGDPRQSIYAFLGGKVDNILNFSENFNNVNLIDLNKNFRSTQNIVGLSNKIIANSSIKKYSQFKPSESVAEVGAPVELTLYSDERRQTLDIARKIEKLHAEGTPLSEISILVRANSQTAPFEEVLSDMDIPYDVSKSKSFFDRKEILDILSYAKLALDMTDDVSFRRIVNTPNRYLSKKFVEELERFAGDRDMSLMNATRHTHHNSDWKYKKNLDGLWKVVNDLSYQAPNLNAGRFIRNVINTTRYNQHLNDTSINHQTAVEKLDALDRLCEMASKFPNVRAFLANVSIMSEKRNQSKGKDAVVISTIHMSKGLEWDVVFVPNVNDKLMPHDMNVSAEEERRLFYVACSRPRKELYVSLFFYGGEMEIVKESEFILELIEEPRILEMKKELFRGSAYSRIEYTNEGWVTK